MAGSDFALVQRQALKSFGINPSVSSSGITRQRSSRGEAPRVQLLISFSFLCDWPANASKIATANYAGEREFFWAAKCGAHYRLLLNKLGQVTGDLALTMGILGQIV
jgi:hypothetical protein